MTCLVMTCNVMFFFGGGERERVGSSGQAGLNKLVIHKSAHMNKSGCCISFGRACDP